MELFAGALVAQDTTKTALAAPSVSLATSTNVLDTAARTARNAAAAAARSPKGIMEHARTHMHKVVFFAADFSAPFLGKIKLAVLNFSFRVFVFLHNGLFLRP